MKLNRIAFQLHRYLSYLLFAQLLLWIVGGAIFALVPFDSITKSGAVVSKPKVALPAGWQTALARQGLPANDIASFVSPSGPALRLRHAQGETLLLAANGQPLPAADANGIWHFAQTLYHGDGRLLAVRKIERSELRLGIVDELYGQTGVWQARFDDRVGTRLYFDGSSGEFLKARNDFWVVYDLFWRLHVMDYRAGEDFNNGLLRVAALLALLFAGSGLVLTWNAARRDWRRRVGR